MEAQARRRFVTMKSIRVSARLCIALILIGIALGSAMAASPVGEATQDPSGPSPDILTYAHELGISTEEAENPAGFAEGRR